MSRPRLAGPLTVLAAVLGAATGASAADAATTPWAPCSPTGFQCSSLDVPLDPGGATPGTVTLRATRVVATSNPTRTAVVALAGGPGQSALPIASEFATLLAPALATRDLLVFDQRGTGASGALSCTALTQSTSSSLDGAVDKCANQIGPSRAFYTTAQSVADIEALRAAGGYEKLVLFGVSYGTKVAANYAAAYPNRVESLVLDSVVPPAGQDALRRSTFKAIPRVLDALCAANVCRTATTNVKRDLASLAKRLRTRSLSGSVYDGQGRRARARLTQEGLASILLAGDLNPLLRAELPGSLRAALTGDVKPILRLSARSAGLSNGAQVSSAADSDALFVATTCEDSLTMPWTRGAPLAQRRSEAKAAVKGLPAAEFAPFTPSVAFDQYPVICEGWPVASPPAAAPGPLPAVPTLVIEGEADLRTPLENGQALQAAIPGAQLLTVPDTGHSVTGADQTSCSKDALVAFFAGGTAAACPAAADPFRVTPRPPLSLSRVKPYKGVTGTAGRAVRAIALTVNDARSQVVGESLALGRVPAGVGGLRRGAVRVTAGTSLLLRDYEYVPGVVLNGSVPRRGTSQLRVSGSAAPAGSVRITASGRVSGTLGGKRISTKFTVTASSASAADRAQALTPQRAAAIGRVQRALG